jgi:signal transduction histidine kinase
MEPPNVDEARSLLEAMRRDSHRAVELLDGMRNLFRRAGEERQAVDLNEVAREVLESLKGKLQSHGFTSELDLSSEAPIVDGNLIQLRQVLFNLVNNAFEAMAGTSGATKSVRVSTDRSRRDMIAVKVQDTGPGIHSSQLEDIFDPFFTTKPHGTGLGLAICRMIIERHGGQLTASSDGESGAMFEFTLPMKLSAGAA